VLALSDPASLNAMSGDTSSEHALLIGEFADVHGRSTPFVHGISVVNRWLAVGAS
jgi:hypothetical protein